MEALIGVVHRPGKLRWGFGWTVLGNAAYGASQWLILVLLARLASPEAVGEFSLAVAIAGPVFMLSNLQLRTVVATVPEAAFSFREYRRVRSGTALLSVIAILCVALAVRYPPSTLVTVLVFAVAKAMESLSDIHYGCLQRMERLDLVSRSLLWKAVLSLVSVVVLARITGTAVGAAVGVLLAWGLTLLSIDVPNVARRLGTLSRPSASLATWNVVRDALPLGIVSGLISLNSSIPRYSVHAHGGARALGLYSAVSYLQLIGGTLVGAIGITVASRLGSYYSSGDRAALNRLLGRSLGVVVAIGAGGVAIAAFFGERLLVTVFGAPFRDLGGLLVLIMISSTVDYVSSTLGYAVTAFRRRMSLVVMLVPVTGVALASSLLLVPRFGLWGAGIATLCASLTQLVGTFVVFRASLAGLEASVDTPQAAL